MNRAERRRAAVQAAMSVASEVTDGSLDPAELEAAAVAECRRLVGQVIGPDDALWGLQLEVARGVLAAGGIPAHELAEWTAVQRQAEPAVAGLNDEDAAALAACQRLFSNDPAHGRIRRESQVAAAKAIAGSGLLEVLEQADFVDTIQAGGFELGEGESVE